MPRFAHRTGGVSAMAEVAKNCDSERFVARNELEYLLLAHRGHTSDAWKAAIVEWHLNAIEVAVANAWVPGMAGRQGTVVEEALNRFHSHQVKITIARLNRENSNIKTRLMIALECVRFYAFFGADGGARAKKELVSWAGHLATDEKGAQSKRRFDARA